MKTIIDQTGNEIRVADEIESLVSLVPSLTELLFFFKMDEKIKGVTDFCVHPVDKVALKTKVGGPLNFDIDKIESLRPDIVFASKGENSKGLVNKLMEKVPVFICDINSLEDAFKAIEKIGFICNQTDLAQNLTQNLSISFDKLKEPTGISVIYLVWEKPFIVAGNNTIVHDILTKTGIKNAFGGIKGYQKITNKQLTEAQADIVLLPSEPFQFGQHHIEQYKQLLPHCKVLLVDGQYFCWYGNRLLLAVNYLKNLKLLMQSICKKF